MKAIVIALFAYMAIVPAALAIESPTPKENMSTIRAHLEAMNHRDLKAAIQYFSADTRNFGEPVGRAVIARIIEDVYTTFPDWHFKILEISAAADSVVVRTTTSGTHQGIGKIPVNGGMLVDVTPTHKHFEVDAIHWYKMKGGKIVDHYATRDDLSMMQQLGLSPQPKPFDWEKFATDVNKPDVRHVK